MDGRRLLFFAVFCGLLAIPLIAPGAGVTPLMRRAAAEILREGAPGVSLAVVANGKTYYCNAGTSGRRGLAVTNHTLFETASITKVFTTTLLGIDVARGAKSLDDPVGKYLGGLSLRPRMQNATLEMLGTFTAGLPEAPRDYLRLPPNERGVAHYPVSRFLSFVGRWEPTMNPPGPVAYGDASVGLLGLCLGNLRLAEWERRVRTEIFDPLGMHDTALRLNSRQRRRLARGVQRAGGFAPRWPIDAMAAGDGVKSTTADLARFLSAELGSTAGVSPDLDAGMAIAIRTGVMVHRFNEFQALAWRSDPVTIGRKRFWIVTKSGGLPGFTSKISFCRDLNLGVAILTNRAGLDLRDVEFELIKSIALAR